MSSRYETIPIKKNDTGKRVRKPILYPTIPRSLDDIYLQTSPGDRLDLIAFKYYGRPSYYWIIAEANGIQGFPTIQFSDSRANSPIEYMGPREPKSILSFLHQAMNR